MKALGLAVREKKIFKVFPFGCHGNQSSAWNGILLTTFVEDHPRNIPVKFYQNWPSGLGGDVV